MSLFTLGSARAVLVVALVYSFPDVFNVIMALISPYTNQPFIVQLDEMKGVQLGNTYRNKKSANVFIKATLCITETEFKNVASTIM
jgi:hypothetical protein